MSLPLALTDPSLPPAVVLAPMAGVTDAPFRRLVFRYGVDLAVSEMISSELLARGHDRGPSPFDVAEGSLAVQIVGGQPASMAEAARINAARGARVIDINMGCPVKKVVKSGSGAALLRDEVRAGRIMEAVTRAVDLPVTVKMRLGWDHHAINAPALGRIARESGIRALTVHGRTRSDLYSGQADWRRIGEVREVSGLPVIANGDIRTPDDARAALALSGARGVMIGRAALGRPWLPGQIRAFLATGSMAAEPSLSERVGLLAELYELLCGRYGTFTGNLLFRKHVGWFSKGLPDGASFRAALNRVVDPAATAMLVEGYFRRLLDREAA